MVVRMLEFVYGFIVGSFAGVVACALCIAVKSDDYQ